MCAMGLSRHAALCVLKLHASHRQTSFIEVLTRLILSRDRLGVSLRIILLTISVCLFFIFLQILIYVVLFLNFVLFVLYLFLNDLLSSFDYSLNHLSPMFLKELSRNFLFLSQKLLRSITLA